MKTHYSRLVLVLTLAGALALGQAAPGQSSAERVKAWQDTLVLPTYAWIDDDNPVFPEFESHIYYPYTRQDRITAEKQDRTYRTLCLENEFLRVTCIPELGGRIHSVLDKTTGEEMFHKNDEIKPALIAMRGAWISGGIEWNVGPQGHTVTIVSPVDATAIENEDGSATLVIGNTEKMFRTRWTVRLTLHPGQALLDERIRMFNPTDGVHPYYFWNCTAFPNLPGTRFVYPMTLGTDHAGTTFFRWPINNGVDLSLLENYPTMSSIFAYECIFDFFGAYDEQRDRGIVSYANHHVVTGKKAWTWGKDDFGVTSQMSLSDAGPVGAQYIEVQSGPLLTQADYGMLRPHQAVTWQEYWYPVHGLGRAFEYATRDVAVRVERNASEAKVHVITTRSFPGAQLLLGQCGKTLHDGALDCSPLAANVIAVKATSQEPLTIALWDKEGNVLLDYASPLAIPKVEPPDLAKKPARPDGQPTAEEKYAEGWLADSQTNVPAARVGYEAALALDPLFAPALCGLATLDLEQGLFTRTEEHARKALERDAGRQEAWYLLGAALFGQGRFAEALDCGYKCVNTLENVALGYSLVGRSLMRLDRAIEAVDAFQTAVNHAPTNTGYRDALLVARYAAGERQELLEELARLVDAEDPTDYLPQALHALVKDGSATAWAAALRQTCGEYEFTATEVALQFSNLGLFADAYMLLNATTHPDSSPMHHYYLVWLAQRSGRDTPAAQHLRAAAKHDYRRVFPARVEALDALSFAADERPKDALPCLLLGHCYAGLRRADEAAPHWDQAVRLDPKLSEAWRALALYAEKKQDNQEEAIRRYRQAIKAAPKDNLLYAELAPLLEKQGRLKEAIALLEHAPLGDAPRYDVVIWLAESYLKEDRFDDCLAVLLRHDISTWEGQTRPHEIFVEALLGRGKLNFDQKQYEAAAGDFRQALTYPPNLGVGAKYELTDAEVRFWLGQALQALGRTPEAHSAWETGAKQITSADPPKASIHASKTQDEYVQKCRSALGTP